MDFLVFAKPKGNHWLLLVILLLHVGKVHAATTYLYDEEISNLLVGNTIVHENSRNGFKQYFSQNGEHIFDPDQGYPLQGQWFISPSGQKLCWWEVDPDLPRCAKVGLRGEQVVFDFGNDSISYKLIEGNGTDLTDNPGQYYNPAHDLTVPDLQKIIIEPPSKSLPVQVAEFSGAWYGTWLTIRDFAIIVEKIDTQKATVIYAWGPGKYGEKGAAKWDVYNGFIEGDSLRINLGNSVIICTLKADGTMDVVRQYKSVAIRSIGTRWEDTPWESDLTKARQLRRENIEQNIAEVYSDYNKEIQSYFVKESIKAGVHQIRALRPTDNLTNADLGPAGIKNCAAVLNGRIIVIQVKDPRCVHLGQLAHEIAHVGTGCKKHNPIFFKYNYAIAQRYESRFRVESKRRWFTPVLDVTNTEDFRRGSDEYRSKEC